MRPSSRETGLRLLLRSLLRLTPKPVSIPSCYPLLQITADPTKCNLCGDCARVCPSNIDLPVHIASQHRIDSPDCVLCQACVNACHRDALSVNSSLDTPRKA